MADERRCPVHGCELDGPATCYHGEEHSYGRECYRCPESGRNQIDPDGDQGYFVWTDGTTLAN